MALTKVTPSMFEGSTGGGGAENYITNNQAAFAISSFTTAKYTAGTRPPATLTSSGSPAISAGFSTSNPLFNIKNFELIKPASNCQGEAWYYDFSVPSFAASRPSICTIDLPYKIASGTFNAGTDSTDSDVICYIAFNDAGTWKPLEPSDFKFRSNTIDKFRAGFQTILGVTQYRLMLYVASTSASAYTIHLDKISVGPQSSVSTSSRPPVGTILPFTGSVVPQGFLLCDGSAVSRVLYSRLFSVIGTSHGSGDGSTTFNIPDYRGRFLRGVDGTAGRDADKASRSAMNTGGSTGNSIGSVQNDEFGSHRHVESYYPNMFAPAGRWGTSDTGITSTSYTANGSSGTAGNLSSASGGSETRPKNAYVNYIICFDDGRVSLSDGYDGRQIATKVYGNPAATTANNPIVFPSIDFDKTGSYNLGQWKAPISGLLKISGYIETSSGSASSLYVCVDGSVNKGNCGFLSGPTSASAINSAVEVVSGQIIDIRPYAGIDVVSGYFCFEMDSTQAVMASQKITCSYGCASLSVSSAVETKFIPTVRSFDSHGTTISTVDGKIKLPRAGVARLSASTVYQPFNASASMYYAIKKNGTFYKQAGTRTAVAGTSTNWSQECSILIEGTTSDVFELFLYQASGTTQNLLTTALANFIELEMT